MRTLFALSFSVLILSLGPAAGVPVYADDDLPGCPSHLPADLQLREDSPLQYQVTCDYYFLDTRGNLNRQERVSAAYTRGLPDGSVRWSDVRLAQAAGADEALGEGEKQVYMEDFTYRLTDPRETSRPEFFRGFPPFATETRNLVWDTCMIEMLGWNYFDQLELNGTIRPAALAGDVPLAGSGTFQNKDVELSWMGITEMNGDPCALIQYRAFLNKLALASEGLDMKGGSHYWGDIWVSLKDKQIERATLYETVVMEITIPGQPAAQPMSVFRRATMEKQS